jgi:hypothetical protein
MRGLTQQQDQGQDWPNLPEHPGRPPGPDASIGELLAYVAASQRRLELWAAVLYGQQYDAAAAARDGTKKRMAVSVRDVEIPFWSMVGILVTVALAAIPALIILMIVVAVAMAVLSVIGLSLVG